MSYDQLMLAQIVALCLVSVCIVIGAVVASWLMLRNSQQMLRDLLDLVPDESLTWGD